MAMQLSLAILPFATIRNFVERRSHPGAPPPGQSDAEYDRDDLTEPTTLSAVTTETIGWAVAAAGSLIPGGRRCLPRALAAEWILLGHGYHPSFKIGVAKGAAGNFEAHAWLECDGRTVIGGAELDRYAEILARGSKPGRKAVPAAGIGDQGKMP